MCVDWYIAECEEGVGASFSVAVLGSSLRPTTFNGVANANVGGNTDSGQTPPVLLGQARAGSLEEALPSGESLSGQIM